MTAVTIDHDSCTNTTATFRHIPHMQERIKHTFMHTKTYSLKIHSDIVCMLILKISKNNSRQFALFTSVK